MRSRRYSGRHFSSFRARAAAGCLLLLAAAWPARAQVEIAHGANLCQQTVRHVARSCKEEAESDYLLALANCDNLSDKGARAACRDTAAADRKDAIDTCGEQEDARDDVCDRLGGGPYDPVIDPKNFVNEIDNPYFPLVPGTTFIYEGPTADGLEHEEFAVTHETRTILGVECVVVHDQVFVAGELIEDTHDYFAQDAAGNVWYFGENSAEVEDGLVVSLEGSWLGGVDGAKPGITMEAVNRVGDFYRQEFALANAEDLAEVVSLHETVTVPYGTFHDCLKTRETTPLDVEDISFKFYCPGIGEVKTADLPPGDENLELVDIVTN
jgi:hypothetical protein